MVFSKDFKFPSDAELTVEECPLGTPYLKAGAQHLGKYCEAQNNEFVLCRHETRDPIKCLPEGKVVTACTNEFFRKVKATCAESFTQFAVCLEQTSSQQEHQYCRKAQLNFDKCMKENYDMDHPGYGYHSLLKVHQTDRPKPEIERPAWLDDPRGKQGKADQLPQDFPRNPYPYSRGSIQGAAN